AERTCLRAVAIDREFLAAKRLADEIRHDTAVIFEHSRPVSVENTHDTRIDAALAMVIHHQRLGDALAFVITASEADRVHIAPISFRLRMLDRVAVNLARRCLQNSRLYAFCEAEHI